MPEIIGNCRFILRTQLQLPCRSYRYGSLVLASAELWTGFDLRASSPLQLRGKLAHCSVRIS